jgi:hypothetical protein
VTTLRYWWQNSKGVFAPKGGQKLAPRQFERQWKGGRPLDTDLAQMAVEYRLRAPGKAMICDFSQGAWAYACGGGSLPNLPQTTDPRLLTAIPQMQPWAAGSGTNRFALRESGQQYLVCLGSGSSHDIDLTQESGKFIVHSVNLRTGTVNTLVEPIEAGRKVSLPKPYDNPAVLWLTRE